MSSSARVSVLGVAAALIVGLAAASLVVDDAIHAFEVKEQPIWNQDWSVDKTYYSAWAMLESCIHDESFKSLDIMRSKLQGEYEPAGDGNTMFEIMENSKLVSPKQSTDTVEDAWWPYARNQLSHASQVCVTSKEDYCCCKDRATWNLYARYTSKSAANAMYKKLADVQDWEGTMCIAMDQGGLFEEKLQGDGFFLRKPIAPSSGPSAGAIVGWVFLALILAALIACGAFFVYKKRSGMAGFALWSSDPEPEAENGDEPPERALTVADVQIDEEASADITVTNPMADAPASPPPSSPPPAEVSELSLI